MPKILIQGITHKQEHIIHDDVSAKIGRCSWEDSSARATDRDSSDSYDVTISLSTSEYYKVQKYLDQYNSTMIE